MILEWNILHRVDSLISLVYTQDSNHLRSRSRAIMALDHSRLGLENKFLEKIKQIRPNFWRSTSLLYKIMSTNLNRPFIFFIHHIWGETVLWGTEFDIQTSERMQNVAIIQDKLHSFNIQDDPASSHFWQAPNLQQCWRWSGVWMNINRQGRI